MFNIPNPKFITYIAFQIPIYLYKFLKLISNKDESKASSNSYVINKIVKRKKKLHANLFFAFSRD